MTVLVLILLTIEIDFGSYNPTVANKPACLRYLRNNNVRKFTTNSPINNSNVNNSSNVNNASRNNQHK